MRDEKSGKTRIKFLFGIAVIVAAVYISFKYLIVYVWPFVIGVFIAVILEKKVIYLSDKLYIGLDKLLVWNKRITIKKKKCQGIAATIIVSLIFVVLLALFSFIIFKGVDEFSRLLRNLDYNLIAVKQLTARMCFDADAFLGLEGGCCLESLIACGHKLMSIMPEKIILISAPVVKNIVIIVGGIVVCFIAVIYLVSDLQKFRDNIRQVVFYEEIRMIWKEVRRLINIYFKVQLRIMLINSGLCMLAFAILKNPYAIVLGIIIGIIDALPVFGTGTVLIPWILISFLIRNYRYAVILLMAYIITYFVREIMESKSMGDRLGISPFTMLVIIFTGLLVYGVADFRDEQALTIAQAFNRRDLSGCDEIQMNNEKIYGKISGESVYVYPPGIPILCPGEVITRKIIAILQAAGEAGLEVVGVKEGALLCLR